MKQRIQLLIASALFVAAGAFTALVPLQMESVSALDPATSIRDGVTKAGGGGENNNNINKQIKTVINVLLFVLGAVAVIMIVLGGIRYTISGGDASQIKGAKDTVLYSVIGLVVAMLAYAIVNFVVDAF